MTIRKSRLITIAIQGVLATAAAHEIVTSKQASVIEKVGGLAAVVAAVTAQVGTNEKAHRHNPDGTPAAQPWQTTP